MTPVEDHELHLKGLVLVRAILEARGSSTAELDAHDREITRVRARLALLTNAKGGDAHSVAA
jgi:hypothetical protein